MKIPALLVLFTLVVGSISATQAAVIAVDHTLVTSSTEIPGFDRKDNYLVDGSGLTGLQHTGTVEPNMWLSAGTGFGGEDLDPWVQFDLTNVYDIDSIQVWNYNENPPNLTNRGVNAVTIEYATTFGFWTTIPGITNFAQANAAETYTGEVFNLGSPIRARWVRFDIDSNHGDGNNFYGLSEVQFDGNLVYKVMPEPSTTAFFLVGLGMFAGLRRKASTIDD